MINERIRDILKALSYTPRELAQEIGVSLYKSRRIIEDEAYMIKFDEVRAIQKLLGLNSTAMDRLLGLGVEA